MTEMLGTALGPDWTAFRWYSRAYGLDQCWQDVRPEALSGAHLPIFATELCVLFCPQFLPGIQAYADPVRT